MKSAVLRTVTTTAGLAAVGVLVATSAYAHAAPFTVKAGSAKSGTAVAVKGTSGTILFQDTTTGIPLKCTSATLSGLIKAGTAKSGTKLATINGAGAVFNNCTGPAGLKFKVTGIGTWYINITSTASGVSKGTVSNIVAKVASTAGPTCTFYVGSTSGSSGTIKAGTVAGTYTNKSSALAVPATKVGSLGLWNVSGGGKNTFCVAKSIINQGDKASFSATFTLKATTSKYNPIALS